MPPKKLTPAETLTLIADRAEALRKAGVLVVQVDGFSAQLAPWTEPGQPDRSVAEPTYADPLSDPATYPGGRVPGFEREPHEGDPS